MKLIETASYEKLSRSAANLISCLLYTSAPVPTSQIIRNQAILSGICESAECGHEIQIALPEV